MAVFLWLACPLLVKELDCTDVDFWEGPTFQKEGVINRLDFLWVNFRPFVDQK